MENDAQPLVSIGIPTYNRPEGLRRTLGCITGQTYKNLEIIISDNGTPGPAVEKIMAELMTRDGRVKYFKQPQNKGMTFNFRFVLDQASGDYFMWATDDDYWEPEFIATMVGLLQINPQAVMAFCSFKLNVGPQVFNYLDEHSGLSSPDINKRINTYLSWPDETAGKASIFYSLYRRLELVAGVEGTWFYWSMQNYAPDNFFIFYMLTKGSVVFSSKALYMVTADNVKEYESRPPKKFILVAIFLIFFKYLKILKMITKYYFFNIKTLLNSQASVWCKFYWLVRYPFYILYLITKTTGRLLFKDYFWKKYF